MAEAIDLDWLGARADDAATRRSLAKIARRQRLALEQNRLQADPQPLRLRLDGRELHMEWGAAFSALEVYQEIFRDRDHERVAGFLEGIGDGLVVDLGANYGFFALRLKELHPECQVCCVEANPHVFPWLCANLEANGHGEVRALHAAAAGEEGMLDFAFIPELPAISGKGLSLVDRPWMRDEFIRRTQVPCITLGRVMETCGPPFREGAIELLKLDVEGMELEVLEAGRSELDRVVRVVVEYHSQALREGVARLLREQGFTPLGEHRPCSSSYYGELYFHRRRTT